jgi:hypothetical protein
MTNIASGFPGHRHLLSRNYQKEQLQKDMNREAVRSRTVKERTISTHALPPVP